MLVQLDADNDNRVEPSIDMRGIMEMARRMAQPQNMSQQ